MDKTQNITAATLAGKLIAAQEAERRRIARELHDDVSQRMAVLAIDLQGLHRQIPEDQHELRASLEHLVDSVGEISSEIQRLSRQLHPALLGAIGLVAALKSLCAGLREQHPLTIRFDHRGATTIPSKDIELCLYRVTQESLSNVIRHSGATAVRVELDVAADGVRLLVSDDGKGFRPETDEATRGLGLISMQERVGLLGGRLVIRSQRSRGTQIQASIPLVRADDSVTNPSTDREWSA